MSSDVDRAAASLRAAAAGGFVALVRMLLKKHSNNEKLKEDYVEKILNGLDKDGASPLFHAAFVGHAEVVEVLLAQTGIKVNQKNLKDVTPLRAALGNDNPDATELLLEHTGVDGGWTVDGSKEFHQNWNPLCHASTNGYIYVVNLLLARDNVVGKPGPDSQKSFASELELQNGDGMTALYLASNGGHTRVVKSLLKVRANVDQLSKGNLTPLYGAALAGHARIVEILLDKGASQKHRSDEGDTALDAAVKGGHGAVAELLMEHAASQE